MASLAMIIMASSVSATPLDGGLAYLNIEPKVEAADEKLYSDAGDDHTQIWYTVSYCVEPTSSTECTGEPSWKADIDLGPKEYGDCAKDYEVTQYVPDGYHVQFEVYSNDYGDGRPVKSCYYNNRIDPSVRTPTQDSAWLQAHQSDTLTYEYNIETK